VRVDLKYDLLLAKRNNGLTAWDCAVKYRKKEILETLCGWGREVQVNLRDDLLLAQEHEGLTAWNYAAKYRKKRFKRHCGVGVEKCE